MDNTSKNRQDYSKQRYLKIHLVYRYHRINKSGKTNNTNLTQEKHFSFCI